MTTLYRVHCLNPSCGWTATVNYHADQCRCCKSAVSVQVAPPSPPALLKRLQWFDQWSEFRQAVSQLKANPAGNAPHALAVLERLQATVGDIA